MTDAASFRPRSNAQPQVLRAFEPSSDLTQRYELARALAGVEDPPNGFSRALAAAIEQGLKATLERVYQPQVPALMTLERSSEHVLRIQVEESLHLPPGSTRELLAVLLVDELKYALARGERLELADSVTLLHHGLFRMCPPRLDGAAPMRDGHASDRDGFDGAAHDGHDSQAGHDGFGSARSHGRTTAQRPEDKSDDAREG